jgi:hypothetical protein
MIHTGFLHGLRLEPDNEGRLSSETSVNFQITRHFISVDNTLNNLILISLEKYQMFLRLYFEFLLHSDDKIRT